MKASVAEFEQPSATVALPYYRAIGRECEVFEHAWRQNLPMMLKGPTGCGKTRFVEHMAARVGRPLVTVACNDDTSSADLLGRWIVTGDGTTWQDGPVARAVREGAILYLDEIAEARSDVVVVLHPLTDHRRRLIIDRRSEEVAAAPGFMLVVSFNPGYQRALKELKPSTRQRFLGMTFGYPPAEVEIEIIRGETGVGDDIARRLVKLATRMRSAEALGLAEPASTRLLVDSARLIGAGLPPRLACEVGIVEPLTDDRDVASALKDLVALTF
jgi:nitric oxide reductase NorQ protein